ncbi:MAG: NAD(+)/NADH kinase [Nitrospirae bacterium]|nr:NAD(+)/NADH kinase [Nitrospirota bacterium]
MKKIGIIAKPQNTHAVKKILDELLPWLARQGKEAIMDSDTASVAGLASPHRKSKVPSLVEMVIVLGGDGTLLSVARVVEGKDVPILGVNLGGLGFLTEVAVDELFGTLEKIFKNEFVTDDRLMLKATVHRQGESVAQSLVLNDVVISKGTLARMIKLEIFINRQFVTALRGDGLILASPTGSTAYSLSAGGPIIYPSVEAMVLTPISPHTLTNRPVVIPNDVHVEVILKTREEGTTVTFDGQVGFSLRHEDVVEIWTADSKIKLIRSPQRNYYEVLRRKLKWGEE